MSLMLLDSPEGVGGGDKRGMLGFCTVIVFNSIHAQKHWTLALEQLQPRDFVWSMLRG